MYKVNENYVDVIGKAWGGFTGYLQYAISNKDIETIKSIDKNKKFRIKNFEIWLKSKAGDFQSITDYSFVIDILHKKQDFKTEKAKNMFIHLLYGDN